MFPTSNISNYLIVFVSPAGHMSYVEPLHMHWRLDVASSHTKVTPSLSSLHTMSAAVPAFLTYPSSHTYRRASFTWQRSFPSAKQSATKGLVWSFFGGCGQKSSRPNTNAKRNDIRWQYHLSAWAYLALLLGGWSSPRSFVSPPPLN